jgi:CYTH domain-containing protein
MGQEIERKFLVTDPGSACRGGQATSIVQGYLSLDPERTVRVRVRDGAGRLTVKGRARGLTRVEHEWPIPLEDAQELLAMCLPSLVEKTRHVVTVGDHQWEVDVFAGDNAGLVVAEVELSREDEALELPPWVGDEVSHDPAYTNAQLAQRPFGSWVAGA